MVSVHPCLIYESMHKVKESFEAPYGIKLIDPSDWYPFRLDTCANFILDDEKQVRNYISYLQRLDYPRRPKNTYEDTGLYFASRNNTLKVYCKGEEFRIHDMKRLTDEEKKKQLHEYAQKILRIEVEHRRRIHYVIGQYEKEHNVTFKKFQGCVRMKDFLDVFNFEEEMKRIASKILCGTDTKLMETEDVLRLLKENYSDRQARSFHHIYLLIVTQGQKRAKKVIPKGTFYRAVKAFRKLRISLMVLDKNETGYFIDKGVPEDFSIEISEGNYYYQLPRTELIPDSDDTEEPF
jgi:II/X family phage/plasmid replication protein